MKISALLFLPLVILIPSLAVRADAPASLTPAAPDTALKISNGQSIDFLGDSITQYGWDDPAGYVHLVIAGFKSIGVTVQPFPAGISGETSRDMLKRVKQSVISHHPTWMTLSCGVNDVWHKVVGLDEYEKNITSIVDQVQAAGIKVMIFTSTPIYEDPNNDFNQRLAPYNDFLRQLAKQRNLPLVDMYASYQEKEKSLPPATATVHPLTVDGIHPNPEGNFLFARGILEAFGATPAQLAAYETQWRQSNSAAGIYGGLGMSNGVEISPEESGKIAAAAKAQKMEYIQVEIVICYRALMIALKAHENDPEFSPTLNSDSITPEMNKAIINIIDALPSPPPRPTAAAPTPAPATPPAATSPTATPPVKRAWPRFGASMFMATRVPVSLAVYNNVVATAQARHISQNDLIFPLFFQAVRNAVKTMGDQEPTLTFDQAFSHFVPLVYKNYGDLLKSLPPAPAPTEAPAPTAAAPPTK